MRSATTGSFFAAADAGISPEIKVSTTLKPIIISACHQGNAAMPQMPASVLTIIFITSDNKRVMTMPKMPAIRHIIKFSVQSNHFRCIYSYYSWTRVRYIIRTYGSRGKPRRNF